MECHLNQPQFQDPETARQYLEAMRWPEGVKCLHCDSERVYKLTPKEGSKKPVRAGLYKCGECRERFTATMGTIFENSKIPLNKWLPAIHLMCASKKGMSSHQIHRMLGVNYKTAWFMTHRIRFAISEQSTVKLKGVIEADETYVGGVQKGGRGRMVSKQKRPVLSIVKRGGEVRSFHLANVTAETLGDIIKQHVDRCAHLCTDEFQSYNRVADIFAAHKTVKHSAGEYVRGYAHVNSAEGFFSLLKRGLNGTYHKVSEAHLHRYLGEFDFRYNHRKVKDHERAALALKKTIGKRLALHEPSNPTPLTA